MDRWILRHFISVFGRPGSVAWCDERSLVMCEAGRANLNQTVKAFTDGNHDDGEGDDGMENGKRMGIVEEVCKEKNRKIVSG